MAFRLIPSCRLYFGSRFGTSKGGVEEFDWFTFAHDGTVERLSGVSERRNPDRESNDFGINAISGDRLSFIFVAAGSSLLTELLDLSNRYRRLEQSCRGVLVKPLQCELVSLARLNFNLRRRQIIR